VKDALGRVSSYTYDDNGNTLSFTRTRLVDGVPEVIAIHYEYDKNGRRTKVTQPDGAVVSTTYNAVGLPETLTDAQGRKTTHAYDALGQLVRTTHPDGTSESFEYDENGRRTSSTDRAGRETTYTYDLLGRLTRTTHPDGTTEEQEYDALGRMVASKDVLGRVTRHEYDAAGRQTRTIDALGNVSTFEYDAVGNHVATTSPNGQRTEFGYDALNRQVLKRFADGTTEEMAFDAQGNRIRYTDQAGVSIHYTYDLLGQLTAVTDALGGTTTYTHDELGNVLTQTDANAHTTKFAYDARGLRVRRTLPLGQPETSGYDVVGNLVSRKDFTGHTTTYTYDAMNRLLSRTPDASFNEPPVSFTYTPSGKRKTMTDALGTTTYTYDSRDRLLSKASPVGTLHYTYNLSGERLTLRSDDPDGVATDYAYDALDRLVSVTDRGPGGGVTTYTYDSGSRLTSYAYPNGVSTQLAYDNLGRINGVVVTHGGQPLASYAYTLGATGNRLSVAELSGRTVGWTYDSLYRLREESIAGGTEALGLIQYTYDAVGNRLSRTSTVPGIGSDSSTYDANDRLTTDTYDETGSPLESGGNLSVYDSQRRRVRFNDTQVVFQYDGDGRRVSRTAGGLSTTYLVDEASPTGHPEVVEERVGGKAKRVFTYGSKLISQRDASGVRFYGFDEHSGVRFLTDASGAVTDEYAYDAFGTVVARSGSTPNERLYRGEPFDAELGIIHLRARDYHPLKGRFETRDAYEGDPEEPDSLHDYVYASNSPVDNYDPTGMFSMGEMGAVNGISSSLATMNVGPLIVMAALARFGIEESEDYGQLRMAEVMAAMPESLHESTSRVHAGRDRDRDRIKDLSTVKEKEEDDRKPHRGSIQVQGLDLRRLIQNQPAPQQTFPKSGGGLKYYIKYDKDTLSWRWFQTAPLKAWVGRTALVHLKFQLGPRSNALAIRRAAFQEAFQWIKRTEGSGGTPPTSVSFPEDNPGDERVDIVVNSGFAFVP
jgi:RHS repeat-associated protein